MTLTRVLDEFRLQNYLEVISKVGDSAGKEYQIESALNRMEEQWRGLEFDVQPYKKTMTFVVRNVDEAINLLDEHIVQTQAMNFSPFKKVRTHNIESATKTRAPSASWAERPSHFLLSFFSFSFSLFRLFGCILIFAAVPSPCAGRGCVRCSRTASTGGATS